jgi:hypothetical protein
MAHNPSERDDSQSPLPEPSFYRDITYEMRKVGGNALFSAAPDLEEVIGPYYARSIAAQIFSAMLKVQKGIVDTQSRLPASRTPRIYL